MAAIECIAGTSLRLPCGLVLNNRLVKTAMSEKMATDSLPSANHERVYKTWAQGGWAALITGMFIRVVYLPYSPKLWLTASPGN